MSLRRWSGPLLQSLWVVLLSLGLAVLLFHFVFQPFQVAGLSMAPALNDRDYLLVDRLFFRGLGVRRGDMVVFQLPGDGRFIVKRVEGLPGERVEIHEGRLRVNGLELPDWTAASAADFGPRTLARDEFLCLGDNSPFSLDSRSFGPVPRSRIYGRVLFRYLPLTTWGFPPGPAHAR